MPPYISHLTSGTYALRRTPHSFVGLLIPLNQRCSYMVQFPAYLTVWLGIKPLSVIFLYSTSEEDLLLYGHFRGYSFLYGIYCTYLYKKGLKIF